MRVITDHGDNEMPSPMRLSPEGLRGRGGGSLLWSCWTRVSHSTRVERQVCPRSTSLTPDGHRQSPALTESPGWSPPPVSGLVHSPPCYTNIIFYVCRDVKKKGIHCVEDHLPGTPRREFLTCVGAYIRQQMWGAFPLRPTSLTQLLLSRGL